MNFWKKLGNLVVAYLPMVLSFILQFACAFAVMFVCIFVYAFKAAATNPELAANQQALTQGGMEFYLENMIWAVTSYQFIALIIFALWYAFGMKQRNLAVPKSVRNFPTIVGAVVLGIGAQFAISGILQLLVYVIPDTMQAYVEMMETTGIGEMNAVSVLATVILAPIGEEILCRGITLRLAKKVSGNFWVANCIQALAFGILHGNIVQGTYAFILGLIFGVLYERYQSLYVPMLVHLVVNFSGTFLVGAAFGNLEPTIMICSIVAVLGIVASIVGMIMMKNRAKNEEGVANGTEQ